jgi:hypothetical protein
MRVFRPFIASLVALLAYAQTLSCALYSGSGTARDTCCRGLASLYVFGSAAGGECQSSTSHLHTHARTLFVPSAADTMASPTGDDTSYTVALGASFTYFGTSYTTIFPSTNGLIGVGTASTSYTSVSFPTSSVTTPVIAVWWNDGITTGIVAPFSGRSDTPNNIFVRVSTNPSSTDRTRIAADVAASLPWEPAFTPVVLAAITWYAVGYYSAGSAVDKLNTYQAVLAADAMGRSFVTMWWVKEYSFTFLLRLSIHAHIRMHACMYACVRSATGRRGFLFAVTTISFGTLHRLRRFHQSVSTEAMACRG